MLDGDPGGGGKLEPLDAAAGPRAVADVVLAHPAHHAGERESPGSRKAQREGDPRSDRWGREGGDEHAALAHVVADPGVEVALALQGDLDVQVDPAVLAD